MFVCFQSELSKIEKKLAEFATIADRFIDLKDQINIKENEIKMLQQKLSGSSHGQLLQEIENLKAAKGTRGINLLVSCK